MNSLSFGLCLILMVYTRLTTGEPQPEIDSEKKMQILRVENLLVKLNKQVENILDDSQGILTSTTELFAPELITTDSSILESRNNADENKDQKFSTVLDELQTLEEQVNEAIKNLTSERRYPFSTMLKPMVQNINVLRNNLSLMQNRLLGLAALSNISKQVHSLTEEIGKVLNDEPETKVKTQKKKVVKIKSQINQDAKRVLGALSWVND